MDPSERDKSAESRTDDGRDGSRTASGNRESTGRDSSSPGTSSTSSSGREPPGGGPGHEARGENHHRALLLDCISNPERGVERLPFVLSLLESDERQTRLLAATTGCLLAVETDDEEVVEYLIRRMSDRLAGDQRSLELTTALDYLSSQYPEQVDHLLAELHGDHDDVPLPEVGSFTRNYYYSQEFERQGVGRTRVAGEGVENPHETVTDRRMEEELERERDRGRGSADGKRDTGGDEPDETAQVTATNTSNGATETTSPSEIAGRSRFDEVYVEGQHYQGRYATVYETLVGSGGNQRAISLRILNRPDESGDVHAFETELRERLGDWAVVADHDHVVPLWDWGIGPRPWLATSFTDGTLAGRDHTGFESGLEVALSLARALSYVHQHNVVHGAIDPRNVVFHGESFTEGADENVPLLDNVGLVHAFREHFPVRDVLDLRFTAPEYYSDQFGPVDHMTDIYQLGATCYYLFTGRPPYSGTSQEVRDGVLGAESPAPSTVADVPSLADDIVSKALARDKIRRYETVEQFHQELRSIASEDD